MKINKPHSSYMPYMSHKTYLSCFVLFVLLFSFLPFNYSSLLDGEGWGGVKINTARAAILSRAPNNLGLVGYWAFNEGAGTLAMDSSGQNNTGTISGAAWTDGKRGKALSFNGSSDFISVGNINESQSYTFGGWFKTTAVSPNDNIGHRIITVLRMSGGSKICIGLRNNKAWVMWLNSSGAWDELQSSASFNNGYWHHITATTDGTNFVLYVNGVQVNSKSSTFTALTYAGSDYIGQGAGSGGYFNGQLDDVRIYNRALSATEVAALYQSGSIKIKAATNTGLVGYWAFNEGAGTKANDSSGNGNHGIFPGGASNPSWVYGKHGKALSFDGDNDYVTAPSSQKLRPSRNFTISAWVKFNNFSDYNEIIAHDENGGGDDGYILRTDQTTGTVTFSALNGNGFTSQSLTSSETLVAGNWYHVLGIYDDSYNLRVYINGIEDFNSPKIASGDVTYSVTTNVNFGRRGGTAGPNTQMADGVIDEVLIYNRALTATEVQDLYGSGQATFQNPSNQGLVGYWNFEENAGTKAGDASGNGNTGAISGASWVNGKRGKALSFNGSSNIVNAGNTGKTILGVSFWMKPNSSITSVSTGGVISFDGNTNPGGEAIMLGNFTGLLSNEIIGIGGNTAGGGSEGRTAWCSATESISSDWHHIAFSWQDAGSYYDVYLDGVLKTNCSSLPQSQYVGSNIKLGWGGIGSVQPSSYFNGLIDEVRIYNRALSATEILNLYKSK